MATPDGGVDALVACLEEEYAALLAEDLPRLTAALERKQRLLEEFAAVPGIARARGTRPDAAARRRLEQLRSLNQRNAQALAPRFAMHGARLRVLQAALGRAGVYGADGSLAGAGTVSGLARGRA